MKAKSLIIAASLLLCVCGCADLLKQPYPAKDYFGIEPGVSDGKRHQPSTEPFGNETSGDTLLVIRTVRVTAPYNGVAFIYKVGPSRYTADYYANWIAEPSALLTAGLAQWFGNCGPLYVVSTGSGGRANWILDCDVTRLVVDKTVVGQPRAIISAHIFLFHQTGSDLKLVSDVVYQEQSRATADRPDAYAQAFGKAYRRMLIELSADIGSSVK